MFTKCVVGGAEGQVGDAIAPPVWWGSINHNSPSMSLEATGMALLYVFQVHRLMG